MKKIQCCLLLLCLSCTVFADAPEAAAPMPPPPPPGAEQGKGQFRKPPRMRGSMIWRAFVRLDKTRQQELVKLQHTDPEKFAEEMKKLAEQVFREEQKRRVKINALIERYHKSSDAKEKETLKKELTALERIEFERGLSELTRILEESRRRVAFLEKELEKRKKNAAPAVETRVDALLKGEIKLDPNMPPPQKRRPRPPFGAGGEKHP